MKLINLQLAGFRSYLHAEFTFSNLTTVLVGPNAIGKTNVLEAIYLLATGQSFRADKIEEMVHWEGEVGHVTAKVDGEDLRVTVTRGMVQGKKVSKRRYFVNGVARRSKDFAGILKAVLFRPEDVGLVTGSPSSRRQFLDETLVQLDAEYRRSLLNYEQALRRRNRLLDAIAEGKAQPSNLVFWDQLLIKHGDVLRQGREAFISFLNAQPALDSGHSLEIDYDASIISEARLAHYSNAEIASGHTLVGPHRDDFAIREKGKDLAKYGSRGEQRMGVLWLKLGQLSYLKQVANETPLLLLDDVFSELDVEHEGIILALLGKQQTIITTTEVDKRFTKIKDLAVNYLEK